MVSPNQYQISCNFREASTCQFYQDNAPNAVTSPYRDHFTNPENLLVVLPSEDMDRNYDWDNLYTVIETAWQSQHPDTSVVRLSLDQVCVACAAMQLGLHVLIDTTLAERSRWLPTYLHHLTNIQKIARPNTVSNLDVTRLHVINQGENTSPIYELLNQLGMKYTNYAPSGEPDLELITRDIAQANEQSVQFFVLQVDDAFIPTADALAPRELTLTNADFEDITSDDISSSGEIITMEKAGKKAPSIAIVPTTPEDDSADAPTPPSLAQQGAAIQLENDDDDLLDDAANIADATVSTDSAEPSTPDKTDDELNYLDLSHLSTSDDDTPESEVKIFDESNRKTTHDDDEPVADETEEPSKSKNPFDLPPIPKPESSIDESDDGDLGIEFGQTWDEDKRISSLKSRYPIWTYFDELLREHTPSFDDKVAHAEKQLADNQKKAESLQEKAKIKLQTYTQLEQDVQFALVHQRLIENAFYDAYFLVEQLKDDYLQGQLENYVHFIRQFCIRNFTTVDAVRTFFNTDRVPMEIVDDDIIPTREANIFQTEIRFLLNIHPHYHKNSIMKMHIYNNLESYKGSNYLDIYLPDEQSSEAVKDWVFVVVNRPQYDHASLQYKIAKRDGEKPFYIVELHRDNLIHSILNPDRNNARQLIIQALELTNNTKDIELTTLSFTTNSLSFEPYRPFNYTDELRQLQTIINRNKNFLIIDPTQTASKLCVDALYHKSNDFWDGTVSQSLVVNIDLSNIDNEDNLYMGSLEQIQQEIKQYFDAHLYSISNDDRISTLFADAKFGSLTTRFNICGNVAEEIASNPHIGANRLVIIFNNLDDVSQHLEASQIEEFLETIKRLTEGNPELIVGIVSNIGIMKNNVINIRKHLDTAESILLQPLTQDYLTTLLNQIAYEYWQWLPPKQIAEVYKNVGGHLNWVFAFLNEVPRTSSANIDVEILSDNQITNILTDLISSHDLIDVFKSYFDAMQDDHDIILLLSDENSLDGVSEDELWEQYKQFKQQNEAPRRSRFALALQRLQHFGFISRVSDQDGYSISTQLLHLLAREMKS